MRLKFYFILFLAFFCSCSKENEKREVYNLIVNKVIIPIPPPPPKNGDTISEMSQKVIDSINLVPLKVAVSSKLLDFEFKNEKQSFSDKINKGEIQCYVSNDVLESKLLFGRNNVLFERVSENDLRSEGIYDNYDGVFKVSNIKYNEGKNEALAVASYSRGKLSGNIILFYIVKNEQGIWEVMKVRSLSTS